MNVHFLGGFPFGVLERLTRIYSPINPNISQIRDKGKTMLIIKTYAALQAAKAKREKILVDTGVRTDNPNMAMSHVEEIISLNHAIKQVECIEAELLKTHMAIKSNSIKPKNNATLEQKIEDVLRDVKTRESANSIQSKGNAPVKTIQLTKNVTNTHLRGKSLTQPNVVAAIDQKFMESLVQRARKYGGLFADVEIEIVDSVKIKPNLIKLTEVQVVEFIEQTGDTADTNGLVRDQNGTPTAILPAVHMDESMFKELISREVLTDTNLDIGEFLLESAEGSFVERLAVDLIAGDSSTKKEFAGIFTDRFDAVESVKPDATRGIEFLEVIKTGATGLLGNADPAAANNIVFNVRKLVESLPTKHRKKAKIYMHKSTWTLIKDVKTTMGATAFDTRDQKLEDFPVVLDDFLPEAQISNFTAENIMAFGDINATIKVVAHPSHLDVNPWKADGGTTYEQVQRLSSWIKDNTAMKVLRGE